jgi:hypothetical protein
MKESSAHFTAVQLCLCNSKLRCCCYARICFICNVLYQSCLCTFSLSISHVTYDLVGLLVCLGSVNGYPE